ncbi:hypothetical protein Tco_1461072, partial [Tanacetum coccineum]
ASRSPRDEPQSPVLDTVAQPSRVCQPNGTLANLCYPSERLPVKPVIPLKANSVSSVSSMALLKITTTAQSYNRVILPLAILNESQVTISCCSKVLTLARRVIVSCSVDVIATAAGAVDDTASGGDIDGSGSKGDLDLLRDDDGNSDSVGKYGDAANGGNGISYLSRRTIAKMQSQSDPRLVSHPLLARSPSQNSVSNQAMPVHNPMIAVHIQQVELCPHPDN